MLSNLMQPGDVIFSYGPIGFNLIPAVIKTYQTLQSLFFTTPNASDPQKIHVFICVEHSNDAIRIAQIGGISKKYDFIDIKNNIDRINANSFEILRPKDRAFAKRLVSLVADEENTNIVYSYSSWINLVSCCPSENNTKTPNGFSLHSNCSLFIAEAISLADPEYLDHPNLTSYGLLKKLKTSGHFQSITVTPQPTAIAELKLGN